MLRGLQQLQAVGWLAATDLPELHRARPALAPAQMELAGGFVYLTPAPPYKVFIQRSGAEPVQILGGDSHKSDLTVSGEYAVVVVWPDGEAPKLALVPLP